MDQERFDELARHVASVLSRRRLLRGALGAAAGISFAALDLDQADAACDRQCRRRCKTGCSNLRRKAKRLCERACKECGGDFDQICSEEGPFGPVNITCCAAGTFCVFGPGICCAEGVEVCFSPDGDATCCEPGTFCDFNTGQCGPPAECTAESGCLGGTCGLGCFCVSSVEGVGACVNGLFANCQATPCETSAECGEGGVCVDVTSDMCCGEGNPSPRVCFPPEGLCGASGVTAASQSDPGWRR
jgi:hypothetical protein